MATKKSKANTNAEGNPVTLYLPDELKEKVMRFAEKRGDQIQAPVSLSRMARLIFDKMTEADLHRWGLLDK